MSDKSQKRFYKIFRWCIAPVLRFFIKIKVKGLENVPKVGPAIIVCNHRSDIDPSIVSIVIPRYISWLAAAYMKNVPLIGWIIKKTGMVLMEVNGKVSSSSVRQSFGVLDRGELLGIFPEGEDYIFANDFSAPLAQFYPGFAIIALRKQVPIVPVLICSIEEKLRPLRIPTSIRQEIGRYHDLDKIKNMVRYKRVKIVVGEPIVAHLEKGFNHKEALARLMRQVRESMLDIQKKLSIQY